MQHAAAKFKGLPRSKTTIPDSSLSCDVIQVSESVYRTASTSFLVCRLGASVELGITSSSIAHSTMLNCASMYTVYVYGMQRYCHNAYSKKCQPSKMRYLEDLNKGFLFTQFHDDLPRNDILAQMEIKFRCFKLGHCNNNHHSLAMWPLLSTPTPDSKF
jgi:hypothetical protein